MNIRLCKMTKTLARQYFRKFEMDPDLFADPEKFKPYVYSDENSDARVDRYMQLGRIYWAIMLDDDPIGELVLKDIDPVQMHCTMGISMRSDDFKNKGYGTTAEILALKYAFNKLGMETVFADALKKNKRSQHVLKKVGFVEMRSDDTFIYYRCDKTGWRGPDVSEYPQNQP